MNAYPRGSTWRRWDLHIHTPDSYESHFQSWDNYLSELEKIQDVAVIGITDYFSIDGYKKILEKRRAGSLKNFDLILPNVELRLGIFVPRRSSGEEMKRLNFHVIFSDELECRIIEEQFLHSLHFEIEGTPATQADRRSLTRTAIEEAGRLIKANQTTFRSDSDYVAGCKNITVSLDQIKELLSKSCFEGKYLLFLAAENWDQIDWAQDYLTRKNLLQHSHGLFCGQSSTIKWCIGQGDLTPEKFIGEFGSLKPSIHGSDAHKEEEICRPKDNKYCWIKADTTFEGFRQIVFEPVYRVRISEAPPTQPLYQISKVKFSFPEDTKLGEDEFCLRGPREIYFSPNLNCLIGGRGSGKSTILNLIYEKLKPESTKFFKNNKPVISAGKTIYDCLSIDDDKDEKYVEFLSQNEIEEFALDSRKFTEAIYQRLEKLDSDGKLKASQEKLNLQLKQIDSQIEDIKFRSKLEKQLDDKKKELETNKKLIESVHSNEYKEISDKIGSADKEIRRIKQARQQYSFLLGELEKIIKNVDKVPADGKNLYEQKIAELVASIESLIASHKATSFSSVSEREKTLESDLKESKEKLESYLKSKGLSKEDLNDIAGANVRVNELTHEIDDLGKKLEESNQRINAFDIAESEREKNVYESIIREQIQPVSKQLESLRGEVKPISLKYEFHEVEAKNILLREFQRTFEGINDKENIVPKIDVLADYLFKQQPPEVSDRNEFIRKIKDGRDTSLNKTQKYLMSLFESPVNFEIYKLLIKRAYSDVPQFKYIKVLYDGKPLKSSSFGQRCTAAIVILLLLGNNPIIIDEPEAHLDSALIANYLVDVIKEKKQHRQIIFATHNANFVINGDAELIHCLEIDDRITKASSTTIENLSHRDKLLRLEGGKEAFLQRGEKYNVPLKV